MKRILILAVLMAGCTDTTPGDPVDPVDDGLTIDAPVWAIGDAWRYTGGGAMTIVVTGESGGDWIVDTTAVDHALYDARTDVSYLGEVRKSDLAGSQGGSRVQFFDFPLEADKQWSTDWDGRRLSISVTELSPGRAVMQGTDGGELYVEYEYSTETRFFDSVIFYENGTAAFTMDLQEASQGYTGEYVRYTLLDPDVFTQSGPGEQGGDYAPPTDATELGITAASDCKGSAAGNIGGILTSRAPDRPYTPQFTVVTETLEFQHVINCQAEQTGADEAVVEIDPDVQYAVDYGVAAQDGVIEIVIEPRILERFQL